MSADGLLDSFKAFFICQYCPSTRHEFPPVHSELVQFCLHVHRIGQHRFESCAFGVGGLAANMTAVDTNRLMLSEMIVTRP